MFLGGAIDAGGFENFGVAENCTVGMFVTFNGCLGFDPSANRIFIEFRDADDNVLGSTSTAKGVRQVV